MLAALGPAIRVAAIRVAALEWSATCASCGTHYRARGARIRYRGLDACTWSCLARVIVAEQDAR